MKNKGAKEFYEVVYQVVGRGEFPIDMLRYDRSCPNSERDSNLIYLARTLTGPGKQMLTITLRRYSPAGFSGPNADRWRSFTGWKVVGVKYWDGQIEGEFDEEAATGAAPQRGGAL